jgi:hypothetical protein
VPDDLTAVPVAELVLGRRLAADERVQPSVIERRCGLGGVVDAERLEVQAGGAQRPGRGRA